MNHQLTPLSDMDSLLSRAEVAQMFNVSPSTVTRWAEEGRLVCVRTLGGHRRYRKESILRLLRTLSKEASVETIVLEIPRMYGDHHAMAVRQMLVQTPGIKDVWVSAAFQKVQVKFDPDVIQGSQVIMRLVDAGYPPATTRDNAPAAPTCKDPAWDQMGLRMTQTYRAGALG